MSSGICEIVSMPLCVSTFSFLAKPYLILILCSICAAGTAIQICYDAWKDRVAYSYLYSIVDIPGESYPNGFYFGPNRQGGLALHERRPIPLTWLGQNDNEITKMREAVRLRSELEVNATENQHVSQVLLAAQKQREHENWERRFRLDYVSPKNPDQPIPFFSLPEYPAFPEDELFASRQAVQQPNAPPMSFRQLQCLVNPTLEPFKQESVRPVRANAQTLFMPVYFYDDPVTYAERHSDSALTEAGSAPINTNALLTQASGCAPLFSELPTRNDAKIKTRSRRAADGDNRKPVPPTNTQTKSTSFTPLPFFNIPEHKAQAAQSSDTTTASPNRDVSEPTNISHSPPAQATQTAPINPPHSHATNAQTNDAPPSHRTWNAENLSPSMTSPHPNSLPIKLSNSVTAP